MKKSFFRTVMIFLLLASLSTGCGLSKRIQGGAIGAGAGSVIGGVIGKQYGKTATGAILGAAIGGTAGALIGNYMDKQEAEMQRDLKDAKIERIGEGIKITFDSGILFAVNSSSLEPAARENIKNLSVILNKYTDTNILVEGHTDSDGAEEYNQKLSEKRSKSVADYAKSRNVDTGRFTILGHGETMPVASNDTLEGKRLNRRVEIAIFANEKLKKAALDGKEL